MSSALKDLINHQFLSHVANEISKHDPSFHKKSFLSLTQNSVWKDAALKQRIRLLTYALHEELPGPYQKNISLLKKVAPEIRGLGSMFLPDYVEVYGITELNEDFSLEALKFFTRFFSSEFAIRVFLKRNPVPTLQKMIAWSKDSDHHIRRLSSEGTRPRLPWSFQLTYFIKNPELTLPILENLKDDDSLYVRKSVANHLNDLSKDHPELVLKIAKSWIHKNPKTDWIVKHGLRTLLKANVPAALKLFKIEKNACLSTQKFQISSNVIKIGKSFDFTITIKNASQKPQIIRLEYLIFFSKKTGTQSAKVFQWNSKTLAPGTHRFSKKHSFQQRTTRKHYPGKHLIEIRLNGETVAKKKFSLI